MKYRSPQFELPQAETVFNLVGESTQDGDRLAAELAARRAALERQAKQQPTLFDLSPDPKPKHQ